MNLFYLDLFDESASIRLHLIWAIRPGESALLLMMRNRLNDVFASLG